MRYIWFLIWFVPFILEAQSEDSLLLFLHTELNQAEATIEQAEQWMALSFYHIERYTYDSTQHYANKVLRVGIDNGDKDLIRRAYWYLGRSYFLDKNYINTEYYIQKSLEINKQLQDTSGIIKCANTLGLALRRMGELDRSIAIFLEGLDLARELDDDYFITILSVNLGVGYRTVGNNEVAIKYYEQGRAYASLNEDSLSLLQILINVSNIYSDQMKFDSAKLYLEQAEAIDIANDNYSELPVIYANLSHIELERKNFENSLTYATKALQFNDSTNLRKGSLIVALINMYSANAQLGRHDQGISYLNQAEEMIYLYNDVLYLPEVYQLKSDYFEASGNYEDALIFFKKYLTTRDSLFSQESINEIASLETEVQLSEKEKRIDELVKTTEVKEAQYQNLQTWLIIALVVLLGSLGLVYVYSLKQKAQKLALSQQAAENKLEALRNQINPHFLFNSFTAIQHYILKSEKQNAYNYLTAFAHLLRLILDNASKMTIDLHQEVDILKSYIQLEALRFQDKFEYDFTIQQELFSANPTIPSMIIQPYIENAILHGLSNKEDGPGKLVIRFRRKDDDQIECLIQDNGIGREKAMEIKKEKEKHTPRNSIAMNNTSVRLQILEKAGYPKGSVEVEDLILANGEAGGTRVLVQLPRL